MNGGNGDTNSPPTAKLDASPTEAALGDTIRLDASESSDPDGDELNFSWSVNTPDASNASVSGNGAKTYIVADVSGEYVPEVSVSDGSDSDSESVTVTAQEKLPEQSTVEFENRATDGDSLVAGDLTLDGEVIPEASGEKSGSFTTPGSRDSKQLCFAENNLFKRYCTEITPNRKTVSVELEVERKSVELSVSFDLPYGDPAEADVTVYEPSDRDSTQFTGETTVKLPKLAEGLTREVSGDLITDDPDDSSKLDRLVANETVSANADASVTAKFSALPACSDWLDNDGDGKVDEADLGCANDAGTGYDPEDDNETHYLFRRVSGRYFNDSTFVSGAKNNRSADIADSDFPESITVAIGEVRHRIENKRLADTSRQHFRMKILSGNSHGNYTHSQTSEAVADPDTATGFRLNRVHGFTRFDGGRFYKLVAVKAEPFGGSKNTAIFYADKQNSRLHTFEYFFEKDHPRLQGNDSKMAPMKTATLEKIKNGRCMQISKRDKICKNAGANLPRKLKRLGVRLSPVPPWIE